MPDPGVYRNGSRILRDPQGQLVEVDPKAAEHLLNVGLNGKQFREVTEQDVTKQDIEATNSTLGAQAESFARGGAEALGDVAQIGSKLTQYLPVNRAAMELGKAVTGVDVLDTGRGLPAQVAGVVGGDIAAEKAYEERTKQLREINPNTFGAGELTGNVLAGLATGGVTTAAGKGMATALGRAGLGKVAAGALGTGAATAVEGGIYGAAQVEGQVRAAGQTEGATAEQLLQGIGFGALLGGGLGVGFSAAGSAFRKLVAKADEIAPPPGVVAPEGAGKAAMGASEDPLARIQSNLTGADYVTLQQAGAHNMGEAAVEARSLWKNRQANVEAAVPKMTEALDKLDEAIDSISVNVRQMPAKRAGIEPMLAGVDQVEAVRTGTSQLRSAMTTANDILESIPKDDPGLASIQKRMGRFVHYVNNKLDTLKGGEHRDAADVFIVGDEIKREAQRVQTAFKNTAQRSTDGSVIEVARELNQKMEQSLQEPLRVSLEDTKLWGRAGESQREINRRWKPFLDEGDAYAKNINASTGHTEWADGRVRYSPDTSKVQSWIEGIGTSRGQTAQEAVRNHISAAQDLIDTIAEYHPLDEAQRVHLETARKAYKQVQSELQKIDKTISIANRIDDVMKAEKDVSSLASPLGGGIIGRSIGAVTGAIQAGPMGAVMGAFGMLAKPGSAIAAADQISSLANRLGVKMSGKAGNWVKSSAGFGIAEKAAKVAKAVEPVAKTVQKVAVPASVSLFMGRDKDLESAYERRSNQLIRAQQDPDSLIDNVAKVTGGLSNINPGLAGALVEKTSNAIQFLASKAPSGTLDPTELMPGRKSVVSKVEMARFARIWAAVERPMTVLEDLQRGIATPDQIEALKVVHHETYQAIRASVQDAIIEVAKRGGRIPINTRQQLDLLLDLGGAGEPAFSPKVSDRITQLQLKQPKAPTAPKSRKAPNLVASAKLPQENWPSA